MAIEMLNSKQNKINIISDIMLIFLLVYDRIKTL